MNFLKMFSLFVIAVCFSFISLNDTQLNGAYSNEDGVVLIISKNNSYNLEVAKSALEFDQEPIKFSGSYERNNNLLVLNIKNTNIKPFTIDIPPQTSMAGYEFRVKGNNWGGLEGVHCKVVENGVVTQEAFTKKRGVLNFDYSKTGTLLIDHKGWESAEIDLSKLSVHSFSVTLERENFKESLPNYEFEINGEILKGRNGIEHWELKKIKAK